MVKDTLVRAPATSFIVRVWSDDAMVLRGEIEHLGTGEKRIFGDYTALLRLIEHWREDARLSA